MNNEDAESVPSIGPRAHYCSGLQASLSIRKSPCVHFVGAQTLLKKHGYWPLVRLKEAGAIVLLTRA